MLKRICIFCGSSPGTQPIYAETAQIVGKTLAQQGLTLVYGGGNVGLMGIVADATLEHGGQVIGVIPHGLAEKEVAHHQLTELHIVKSMHERKAMMADLADGFIALPGGFGTYDEFCEILTWAQLGIHQKPCGLLNVADFYTPLLAFFDHSVQQGFIRAEHRHSILVAADIQSLLTQFEQYQPINLDKWVKNLER